MKVEELYSADKDSQIGVTFQRQPFETQVGIFPEVSPLRECENPAGMSQNPGEPLESALTSIQVEEALCKAVKHQEEEGFRPIPVKRVDGQAETRIQDADTEAERDDVNPERSRHEELLKEIDTEGGEAKGAKVKKDKRDSTLTRMKDKLKSLRGDKGEGCEEGRPVTKSMSKIFQRIKPVGKASRESFSKVFHRIGDALQKKEDDKEPKGEDKTLSLDRKEVEKRLRHQD
ncbi:uncharacterized protein LOC128990682 [Macrosteles quadrilineatus]|uniref:uncharacterized protein LOC128990682 n=1 Tax=Macrosteles quadrilineatus TaxID=74068 RepID=UPI0023E2ABD4|nr:uncharacterized protein LOC128990682 [Macrosteles quadrilineatus]